MIRSIFFYANGAQSSISDSGNQDGDESEPWYIVYLRMLLLAGMADARTIVSIPGLYRGQIFGLRSSNLPTPRYCQPDLLVAALAFHPDGRTEAVGLDGARRPAAEMAWYIPCVMDKVNRKAVDRDTIIRAPGSFHGTVGQLLDRLSEKKSAT